METFIGVEIQKDIKYILEESGYNSHLSLLSLKEENIQEIEKYINSKEVIKKKLKTYLSSETFEFKPGHKALLISLSIKAREFISENKNQSSEEASEKATKHNKQIVKTDDELKIELCKKLKSFLKKLKFDVDFTTADISEFIKGHESCKCRMKCPFCEKTLICSYLSHWQVSNFEAHLKWHIQSRSQFEVQYEVQSFAGSSAASHNTPDNNEHNTPNLSQNPENTHARAYAIQTPVQIHEQIILEPRHELSLEPKPIQQNEQTIIRANSEISNELHGILYTE